MKSKLLVVLAIAAGYLAAAGPMFAHHAGSFYDRDHPVKLTGTVTEFEFTNPHVRVHFDVKDESGVVTSWVAESAPPQRIYRSGWNRNTLKPGDIITVDGLPSKDGKKWMSVKKLVAPNGKELTSGAE